MSGCNRRVYFMSLEGVDGLPAGAVTCDFTPNSFDLKILGLGGKNLRFVQRPLCKTIDPAKSKFKLRSSRVTLYLAKKEIAIIFSHVESTSPR